MLTRDCHTFQPSFYLVCFFYYLYRMILALVQDD